MKVHKYALQPEHRQEILMPIVSNILSVGEQGGMVCIWAEVDTETKPVKRFFLVASTGHELPKEGKSFIGTVQIPPFVWHVFELTGETYP